MRKLTKYGIAIFLLGLIFGFLGSLFRPYTNYDWTFPLLHFFNPLWYLMVPTGFGLILWDTIKQKKKVQKKVKPKRKK